MSNSAGLLNRRQMVAGGVSALLPSVAGASAEKWQSLAADVRAQMSWAWHNYVER